MPTPYTRDFRPGAGPGSSMAGEAYWPPRDPSAVEEEDPRIKEYLSGTRSISELPPLPSHTSDGGLGRYQNYWPHVQYDPAEQERRLGLRQLTKQATTGINTIIQGISPHLPVLAPPDWPFRNDPKARLPGQRYDKVVPEIFDGALIGDDARRYSSESGAVWHDLEDIPQAEFQAQIQADRTQKLREQLALLDEQKRQAQRRALGGF